MTVSFLIKSGVPAASVDVRLLPEEADERMLDDGPVVATTPTAGVHRARILLIEDDPHVARALAGALTRHRYTVVHEASGSAGLHTAYAQRPDLVLLDLGLPDIDGYEVLTRLRAVSDVPVIVVTARSAVQDRLHGLNRGADDYLVKPYPVAELLARMERVLDRRRSAEQWAEGVYDDGLIRLDSQTFEASVADAPLKLTPTEFRVLDLLVRNTGTVQPFRKLLARAWDDPNGRDTEKVKFTISRLRRKLDSTAVGSTSILSARGIGYLYRAPGSSTADNPAPSRSPSSRSSYGHAGNVLSILRAEDPGGDRGETILHMGSLRIELPTRQVSVRGSVVELTRKEFDLLALLARRPGAVIRREQIISELFPSVMAGAGRTLDVYVGSLRGKLPTPTMIETVRGVGYRLVVPTA
jgi:two-component system KDP operon response regulator KdpE